MPKRYQFNDKVPQVFLTRNEAAELLRVAPHTVDRWANEGWIQRYIVKVPDRNHHMPRFLTEEILDLIKDWEPGEFGRGGLDVNPRKRLK